MTSNSTKPRSRRVEQVKQAAEGRWLEVLSAIGLSRDVLDGNHHPCPKCGGKDRFRLMDEATGAVICNQCFAKKNGDGIAAIQWFVGCDFKEAVKRAGAVLGINDGKGKKAVDPAKDLEWRDWSSELVAFFIQSKPGVTEAAILAAGGRLARYKRSFSVIALPIIGESLDTSRPVGWVLVNAMGGTLPKWNREGEVVGQTKTKITYGSGPGLIGVHGIERLRTPGVVEKVWKTEGISDLLAVMASIPAASADRCVAITNSNGARQKMGWMAGLLARFDTRVLHDADEPGQVGAAACCQDIAQQGGSPRNVVLPYVVEKDHGKDVRDWMCEGNTYTDLEALAERSEVVTAPTGEGGEVDYRAAKFPVQENILRKLQVEVLYETEDGRIRLFSWLLRKSSWLSAGQVDKIKKEKLVQICGPPAMECISSDPDGVTSWSIGDVRTAIALMASNRREEHNERGIGVWQGQDQWENETDTMVLVNDTEASKWNGAGELERVVTPRSDGLVLDFGSGRRDWFEHAELARYVTEAQNEEWCRSVLESAYEVLNQWRWKNQDCDPTLVTGLIMATWVQAIWTWRPLVVLIGESNSGKSLLFEALGGGQGRRGFFGNLAFKQAKSTEAGIRQGIGNTARVVLCDEFEKSKERDRILEMLRASTRGETISRGTSDQKGTSFSLRHIGWVAAIEAGLQRQPDINRFVQLELLRAESTKQGKLVLPDGDQLYRIGQKLLAISITCAAEAKRLAVKLKSYRGAEGIDARTVEVYAVPAAMLSVACRFSEDRAQGLLKDLLGSVEREEQGRTDHDDLLGDILSSPINCGAKDGYLSIGQIIESQAWLHEYTGRMEAQGVSLRDEGGVRYLVIAHRQVAAGLLRGKAWEGQRIDQVLLRVPGTKRANIRIGGMKPRVILIPFEKIPGSENSNSENSSGENFESIL